MTQGLVTTIDKLALLRFVLHVVQPSFGRVELLLQRIFFGLELLQGLGYVAVLALEVFDHALVFVRDHGQLSVFDEVVALKFVNFPIVFLTLLLKELELLFKCLVASGLHHLNPLFLVRILLFQRAEDLFFHIELV